MNKVTKIAILVVIVGATIVSLAFYATKSKPTVVKAPTVNNQAPKASPQVSSTNELPPLPADNKQAIASEIKGINDSMQSVDDALSADKEDGELGL